MDLVTTTTGLGVRLAKALEGVNPAQWEAIQSRHARTLLIAGAGTGKTHVLVHRVASLLVEGVPAQAILCVTFTNKAADEMRARLRELLGPGMDMPEIRTLHSWCLELLRQEAAAMNRDPDFSVYDDIDYGLLLRASARDLGDEKWASRRIRTLEKTKRVGQQVRTWLDEANAFTFQDLEARALQLLTDPAIHARWLGRYEHLLMDETQDTSAAQYLIVERLEPTNTFYVADPRQLIYSWRGAEVEKLLELTESFRVLYLTQNYRSTPEIVAIGNALAKGPWEPMESVHPSGRPVRVVNAKTAGEAAEASVRALMEDGLALNQIAILGRRWSDLSEVSKRLHATRIDHQLYDDASDIWSSPQGRQLVRVLQLVRNPMDALAARALATWSETFTRTQVLEMEAEAHRARSDLLTVMAQRNPKWALFQAEVIALRDARRPSWWVVRFLELMPTRGGCMEQICQSLAPWVTCEGFLAWWGDRSVQERVHWTAPGCHLLTAHGAKGLEFDGVIVLNVVNGSYPSTRKDADEDEDLRVLAVACTRAKTHLILTVPDVRRVSWGKGVQDLDPSPFLDLINIPMETAACTRRT